MFPRVTGAARGAPVADGMDRQVRTLWDAARAARENGDLRGAESHLVALIAHLDDRHAPLAQRVMARIDLAYVYIAGDDPPAGQRILAGIGSMMASAAGGPGQRALADLWAPALGRSVPAQRAPSD